MPMNPTVKVKWLDALRSGEYRQTRGNLRNDQGYCCLGVLCDLAVKDGVARWDFDTVVCGNRVEGTREYQSEALPDMVRRWAGLDHPDPFVEYGTSSDKKEAVSTLNDSYKKTFDEIADIIEEQL